MHTVKSFVELTRYLLGLSSAHIYSVSISHKTHSKTTATFEGRSKPKPHCSTSAQSLRVQGSMAMVPLRGNSRRKKRLFPEEVVEDTPLKRGQGIIKIVIFSVVHACIPSNTTLFINIDEYQNLFSSCMH